MKGRKTLKERQELLAKHRQQVEQTIEDYQAALELIDKKIDFYEEWIETGQQPPAVATGKPG